MSLGSVRRWLFFFSFHFSRALKRYRAWYRSQKRLLQYASFRNAFYGIFPPFACDTPEVSSLTTSRRRYVELLIRVSISRVRGYAVLCNRHVVYASQGQSFCCVACSYDFRPCVRGVRVFLFYFTRLFTDFMYVRSVRLPACLPALGCRCCARHGCQIGRSGAFFFLYTCIVC